MNATIHAALIVLRDHDMRVSARMVKRAPMRNRIITPVNDFMAHGPQTLTDKLSLSEFNHQHVNTHADDPDWRLGYEQFSIYISSMHACMEGVFMQEHWKISGTFPEDFTLQSSVVPRFRSVVFAVDDALYEVDDNVVYHRLTYTSRYSGIQTMESR